MKIFLGNAPWSKEGNKENGKKDHYGVRAGSRWPHFERRTSPYMPFPFFLAYAAALLKKNGFNVLLIDAIAERISQKEYFNRMNEFSPNVVVHEVSTASIKTDVSQAGRVKELLPESKIIFCGAHHGMYDPKFLDEHSFIDYVCEGEFEFTLLELAQRLKDRSSLEGVEGLLYRGADGAVKNSRRPLGKLDDLPWPAREYLPMKNYWDNPGGIPSPSLQIHTSRGCPFTCSFCVWPQIMYGGNKYRMRNPKDVVDEIEHCVSEYGIKSFYFDDDTFNIGKKRVLALCEELIGRGLALPWAAMARADTADREMLERMKAAGLVSIKYGVESADQEILNNSGKRLKLDVAVKTIRETMELGIKCHLTFTFGLPGETKETIEKTMGLVDRLNPDTLQFSIVTPFPGSRLYREMEEKGYLLSDNFDDYDGSNKAVIRTDALSANDLEDALCKANEHWMDRTFKKKILSNKLFYIREAIKNPALAVRTFQRLFTAAK